MTDTTAPITSPLLFDGLLGPLMTTKDALRMREAIDNFLTKLYQYDRKDLREEIKQAFDHETGVILQTAMEKQKIDQTNQEEISKLLTLAKETLTKARILALTLAQTPTAKTLSLYSDFVKEQFGDDVLIEVNINPTIIAGAIIVFEGRYIDQSIKKKLDILFEAKKEEILKHIT